MQHLSFSLTILYFRMGILDVISFFLDDKFVQCLRP